MSKIPTIEEFMTDEYQIKNYGTILLKPHQSAIEFAKLHVKAALKEALENIPCLGSSTDIPTYEEVEDAVLNAYPEENIK